jgi:hypothetical protein
MAIVLCEGRDYLRQRPWSGQQACPFSGRNGPDATRHSARYPEEEMTR